MTLFDSHTHTRRAVKSIESSRPTFANIHELLKNAIFLKQQLKYEETRRQRKESAQQSVYKRLSAHITLDLPDLPDLSGVVRETTNRMEHMMTSNNNSAGRQAPSTSAGETLHRSHTTLH